jgi:hypothetical protein
MAQAQQAYSHQLPHCHMMSQICLLTQREAARFQLLDWTTSKELKGCIPAQTRRKANEI